MLGVANAIGNYMRNYKLVVNKSTVPVGTADGVRAAITVALLERGIELDFDVCSNQEFAEGGRSD